jgi:hypothetical protein
MAVAANPLVLSKAIALKRIEIGATTELQEVPNPDDPTGEMLIEEVTVPLFADPGDEVDISEWANVEAYVRQGWIHMVTPDIEVRVNRPEKTTGTGLKPAGKGAR